MRTSGILLPLSSLPSPYGIGTLGREAYTFVDFLAAAGQSLWQMLPTGPTSIGDSPYQSFSAMAGNPYYIDLDLLVGGGLLRPEELEDPGNDARALGQQAELPAGWGEEEDRVDYGLLFQKRYKVLARAAARQNKTAPDYLAFCKKNAAWLDDYALFMALKEAYGHVSFQQWPEALRRRESTALRAAQAEHGPRIEFWRCLQFFYFSQWTPLKAYANAQGIQLVGDIPIYVSPDSSDLWAHPELFQVDSRDCPSAVAGVPPDAFSADGQLWGNPLYDWPVHKKTNYAWWIERIRFMDEHFDITRIDHFRGFAGYYAIPAGDTTARNGKWRRGPGKDFIRAVRKALPHAQIIAEDLGFLTDEVHQLLAYSGYPGMKILQFAFDSRDESDYLPHNYGRHSVVYTGTHDNTTTEDWQHSALKEDVAFARKYLALTKRQSLTDGMIRAALQSVADTAVIPMQDWLHLGKSARINIPSTLGGNNWRWRLLPGQADYELAARIREQTRLYGRLSAREKAKEKKAELETLDDRAVYGEILPEAKQKAEEKETIMMQTAGGGTLALRILTAAEMKAAEAAAVEAGSSYGQLMENAGTAAAAQLLALAAGDTGAEQELLFPVAEDPTALPLPSHLALPPGEDGAHSVLLLCGKGNNAGDAFVVGRLLAGHGWRVRWLPLLGEEFSPLAEENRKRMPKTVHRITAEEADFTEDVILDGVLGTGFHGTLPDNVAAIFRRANAAEGLRVALDVPSGLDCDTGVAAMYTFKAALTLTFGAYKPGLLAPGAADYTGEVRCLDIGL